MCRLPLSRQNLTIQRYALYLIRVNRQPVVRDYVLQENDRITMTPTKIEGA
jgi:hypothetical protein